MCGIAGIISLNQEPVACQSIMHMADEMKHRGPNGEGYLVANAQDFSKALLRERPEATTSTVEHRQHLALGFRRLSILDLNANATQPMSDASGRYWIVFNGEIYNHIELRKLLEAEGYRFKTDHSDTEVILNAYDRWGKDCLQKFNGMWAFCIWDTRENEFFISRDRVGKQPLYYTVHKQTFYFASELNALLVNKQIERELDEFAVYDYLTYTNVPSPKTVLKEFKKLPAAHYLLFKPGQEIRAERYWSPFTIEQQPDLKEEDILEEIRNKLYEATRLRSKADVEVGMLLSGGLDSSVNLAALSKMSNAPVKAYTVGFENKNGYQNEFNYARNVASYFKANLTEMVVSEKEFFDFLPEMAYCQDEPIADTANIPIYFISKVAHQDNVKVLLSGEGSDELFIGYEHWRLIYEFEKVFKNKPNLSALFRFLHRTSVFRNRRPHYQDWAQKVKKGWPVFWSGTELRSEADKHNMLSASFLERIGSYNSFMPKQELYDEVTLNGPYDTFKWMTINDLQNRLPDQLLARLDRMMMASSVEGRNPFLDVNLIEYVLRIPPHLKVKNRTEKYLLKKAFNNILPNEIIYRPKDSFTVPINDLFKRPGHKKEYLETIRQFNKKTGILSEAYLIRLESQKNLKEFWNVLNLALWHEKHQ